MPKLNTTVKSVRIDNDTLSELESRIDGTFNSWLNGVIEEYLKSEKPKKPDSTGVYPTIDKPIADNLSQMAVFMGTDLSGLVSALNDGLEDGSLSYENGRLIGQSELKMDRFYEICHDRNLERQKAFDRLVNMLERS